MTELAIREKAAPKHRGGLFIYLPSTELSDHVSQSAYGEPVEDQVGTRQQ